MKYLSKETVDALQFNENYPKILAFVAERASVDSVEGGLIIRTPGANVPLHPGEWLLLHSDRTFESLPDALFKARYSVVKKTT